MPDGKAHHPTIADWRTPAANRWDVTEEMDVPSAVGTHLRTPDSVAFINGDLLVVIEAKTTQSVQAAAQGASQR